MKAVQFSRTGIPWEVATVVDIPEPGLPGPGQALVAVEVSPIEQADLHRAEGASEGFPPMPYVGGIEGMGRVLATGAGVANVRKGDRVLLPIAAGAWQERAVIPSATLFPLPPGDPLQVGQLSVNPVAAWCLLHGFAGLAPGDWVIQNAAGSSNGRYITGLARHLGLRSISIVRSEHAASDLRALGADAVLLDGPGLAERVAANTDGAAPRLGLDAVGGDASARLAACLGVGSTLVVYGMLSGEPVKIPPTDLLFREVSVKGFFLKHWFERSAPDEIGRTFATLSALVAEGKLVSRVQATYPLGQIREALRAVREPGRTGRIVVTPNN